MVPHFHFHNAFHWKSRCSLSNSPWPICCWTQTHMEQSTTEFRQVMPCQQLFPETFIRKLTTIRKTRTIHEARILTSWFPCRWRPTEDTSPYRTIWLHAASLQAYVSSSSPPPPQLSWVWGFIRYLVFITCILILALAIILEILWSTIKNSGQFKASISNLFCSLIAFREWKSREEIIVTIPVNYSGLSSLQLGQQPMQHPQEEINMPETHILPTTPDKQIDSQWPNKRELKYAARCAYTPWSISRHTEYINST